MKNITKGLVSFASLAAGVLLISQAATSASPRPVGADRAPVVSSDNDNMLGQAPVRFSTREQAFGYEMSLEGHCRESALIGEGEGETWVVCSGDHEITMPEVMIEAQPSAAEADMVIELDGPPKAAHKTTVKHTVKTTTAVEQYPARVYSHELTQGGRPGATTVIVTEF